MLNFFEFKIYILCTQFQPNAETQSWDTCTKSFEQKLAVGNLLRIFIFLLNKWTSNRSIFHNDWYLYHLYNRFFHINSVTLKSVMNYVVSSLYMRLISTHIYSGLVLTLFTYSNDYNFLISGTECAVSKNNLLIYINKRNI